MIINALNQPPGFSLENNKPVRAGPVRMKAGRAASGPHYVMNAVESYLLSSDVVSLIPPSRGFMAPYLDLDHDLPEG